MEYTVQEQRLVNRALKVLESKLKTYSHSFSNPQLVVNYLRLLCEHEEREQFIVLFLNTQNQLISHEVLFQGTITIQGRL
ncbi:hypothetical protein GCM10023211_08900 [Orbus sasakiae]|uniref:RadC-like JAB domain-containing protein n=1 Tax=Orbus sasakiae TaxID=1078475 RepID=A0ABP9N8L6_9GAMM